MVHRADPLRPSLPPGGIATTPRRVPPPPCSSSRQTPDRRDLTPYRARVTIREIPQRPQRPPRRPGIWIGGYRVRALDVIAAVCFAALLVVIFWPHGLRR